MIIFFWLCYFSDRSTAAPALLSPEENRLDIMGRTVALLVSLGVGLSYAELIQIRVLARHGNRAPNANVPSLCPNYVDVIQMFDVPVWSG